MSFSIHTFGGVVVVVVVDDVDDEVAIVVVEVKLVVEVSSGIISAKVDSGKPAIESVRESDG
jgi:hypothetical protein